LEYRYIGMYLQNKISKQEMVEKLYIASRHYAKRQMTWFKRNKEIRWFKSDDHVIVARYLSKLF